MTLTSEAFKDDEKLKACEVSHAAHIMQGARGPHVAKIQKALMALNAGTIAAAEIQQEFYGPTTARTVLAYKTDRDLVNLSYQTTADDIVGIWTIKSLDREMYELEQEEDDEEDEEISLYVSLTREGAIDQHDHSKCRGEPYVGSPGADGRAQHLGSAVFPQGWGRKIAIGGEAEHVGFDDYLVYRDDGFYFGGPPRPFTKELGDECASDIAMRSTPLDFNIISEIMRIAANGCRFTFSGDLPYAVTATWMGHLIERRRILTQSFNGTDTWLDVVVVLIDKGRPLPAPILQLRNRPF